MYHIHVLYHCLPLQYNPAITYTPGYLCTPHCPFVHCICTATVYVLISKAYTASCTARHAFCMYPFCHGQHPFCSGPVPVLFLSRFFLCVGIIMLLFFYVCIPCICLPAMHVIHSCMHMHHECIMYYVLYVWAYICHTTYIHFCCIQSRHTSPLSLQNISGLLPARPPALTVSIPHIRVYTPDSTLCCQAALRHMTWS